MQDDNGDVKCQWAVAQSMDLKLLKNYYSDLKESDTVKKDGF